jgi:structural maintenance of chromosome 4
MKPIASNDGEVGLLEYLEDIIGSNKYIEKIKEMEGAMATKNDERIEKTNRVKAAENELKGLEAEKDIAVEYIKKERDFMLLSNMLYFIELHDTVEIYNETIEKI